MKNCARFFTAVFLFVLAAFPLSAYADCTGNVCTQERISNDYTLTPENTFGVELTPTANDRFDVSGTATLNSGLIILPQAGVYSTGTKYTILTASNVVGGFTSVTNSSPSVIFTETYFANAVILTAINVNQALTNSTPNASNVAGAIRSIISNRPVGSFDTGLANLLGTTQTNGNAAQIANAIGELSANSATVLLANTTAFQNLLVDRMDHRQNLTGGLEVNNGLPGTFDVAMNDSDLPLFGPSGVIDAAQPQFWSRGYGVLGTLNASTGYSEAQYRTGGIIGGVDAMVSDTTLLGAAIAYEHTDLSLSGDSDENNIDTYRISLYGSQKLDPVPLVVDAALGYAFNDYHNGSFLPLFTSEGYSQTSRHTGSELTASTGLSDRFIVKQNLITGALSIVPRVGVEYDNIAQDSYTTTGAPNVGTNLTTNGATLNALRSTIGGRADLKLTTDNGTIITPELRAAYLHDFMDTNVTLTQAFAGAPTAGFRISGVHPGREAALVGTGVTAGFTDRISATIGYDAAIRKNELDHTVQVGLKYSW